MDNRLFVCLSREWRVVIYLSHIRGDRTTSNRIGIYPNGVIFYLELMHPFIVNFLSCAYKFAESSGSDFHVVFFELHQGYVLSMADKDVAIRIDEHHTLDSFRERDFSNQLLVFRPYFDYALNV